MIPEKIHFYWAGGPIPKRYQDCIDSWKKFHAIRMWGPGELGIDPRLPVNVQSDLARWRILFSEGGVCCDCDMLARKSITTLLGVGSFAVETGMLVPLLNSFVGSVPGNELMKKILEETEKIIGRDVNDAVAVCLSNAALLRSVAKIYPREYCPVVMKNNLSGEGVGAFAIHKHFMGWKSHKKGDSHA